MAMQMVLFAIGPDRPGLVSQFSSVIHRNGGNLEDSRMVTLAGDFALVMLFSAASAEMDRIKTDCEALGAELAVSCQFRQPGVITGQPGGSVWKFEATGHDQPGIVSRLSTAMASEGVSVIAMDTTMVNMAFIGTPMFRVSGQIRIPDTLDAHALRDALEELCEDMSLVLEFTRLV